MIPKILITAPHTILIDGRKANATLLPISNATHAFLYFTYVVNAHQVTIVSKTYYDLLEKYNSLFAEYYNLNSTYHELLEAFNILLINHNQTQYDYYNLNMTYHQLIGNYDSLQNSYGILLAQNQSLTSTYNSLLASYEDLQSKYNTVINEINNTRNLVYVLTATVIGVAAILFSINIKFRQKISEQDKIIQAYNPLEIARILFMDDVEKRGVKIKEFEKKHGIKIRPRNTLEDVLKDLREEKEKTS